MDLPNLLHHHHHHHHHHRPPHPHPQARYVPVPNSSRPNYPDDPNFNNNPSRYHQHQYHPIPQPQPQPLPPPPPQTPPFQPLPQSHSSSSSSYHTPPIHPYNPGQSQFAFGNPNHDRPPFVEDDRPRSSYPHRDFVRLPLDDDRPPHRLPEFKPEIRTEFWEKSRVLAENLPTERPHPPLDFDSGSQKFQYDYKPMSPYKVNSKLRHEPENSSRFRGEYVDGFESKHRDELLRGAEEENYSRRGSFLSSPGTSFRDMGFGGSNPSLSLRDLESESDSYNGRYGSAYDNELVRSGRRDVVYDNQRRSHDRKFPRDAHNSSFERGSTEFSNGDGAHMGSMKREYYSPELGRYNSRGAREDSHEYNRTPRKQLQKKSALLRIQMAKPNHRNAENEQLHYGGYLDKSNSSSFRRKDQYVYKEAREGSPVELDVSFKSNSLVAKAIVAPMSSSDVTDADLTSRDVKVRKDSLSDKDCSNAELTKVSDSTTNVDSSMNVGKNTSTRDKDTIQSEGKVSSGGKNMCDTSSQACSSVTNHLVEKSEVKRPPHGADLDKDGKKAGEVKGSPKGVNLNKDGTKVGSDKVSFKIPKKKKVVKKIVKRVVRHHPNLSSSEEKKKHDQLVTADACIPTPSQASEPGVASLSCPSPSEAKMVHEKKKVEGSAVAIESKKHGIKVSSIMKSANNIEKNGNSLGTKVKGPKYSVQGLPTKLNSNKDLVKSLDVSTLPKTDVVDIKQSRRSGDSLLLDSGLEKDSLPVTLPTGGNGDSSLLNSGKIKMHNNLMITHHSDNCTLDIVNGTKLSNEDTRVCDVGTIDVLSKLPCSVQVTTLHANNFQEEVSKDNLLADSSAPERLSSLGETTIDVDSSYQDRTASLVYNNISNFEEDTTISSSCTVDHITKQPSTDGATEFPGNFATKSSPNTEISFRDNEGDTSLISKKRTVRSQLDFSRTTDIDLDAVNVSNHTTALDTTLSLSLEDPNSGGVVSCIRSSEVVLPPGKDQVNVLHGNGSSDGFSDANLIARNDVNSDFHVTPPHRRKRRKVLASDLAMPSPTTSQTDEQPADRSKSCVEAPLTANDVLAQRNTDYNRSILDTFCVATNSMHSENGITLSYENKLSEGSSDNVKFEYQLGCHPILEKSVIPTVESICPKESGHEPKKVDATVMAVGDQGVEVSHVESREEMLGVSASTEQVIAQDPTHQCMIPSDVQPLDIGQRFSFTGMESDNLLVKDGFPNLSNSLSLPNERSAVSSTTSSDKAMELVPDALANVGSPQSSLNVSNVRISDAISVCQISNETCREDGKLVEKSVDEDGSDVSAQKSLIQCTDDNLKSVCATESDQAVEGKTETLPSQNSKSMSHGLNISSAEYNGQKNQTDHAIPRTFPGRSSFGFTPLKKKATLNHANTRTWRRNSVSSASPLPGSKPFSRTIPSQRQLPERDENIQSTSYVRKGNSLVRKPSPAATLPKGSPGSSPPVYRLNSPGLDDSSRSIDSDHKVGVGNSPGLLRMVETKGSCDKPSTTLIQSGTKSPYLVAIQSGDCRSSPSAGPPVNGCCEATADPISSLETNDTTKFVEDSPPFENQNGQLKILENETELDDGKLAYLDTKRLVYVKRKSNQLVATSNSTDLSVPNSDKMQPSSFDGYYKRRKNQLVRTSMESHTKQPVVMPNDNLNPAVQMALKAISSRRISKRRLQKVVAKTFKRSTNSLVWTLCTSQSSKNNSGSVNHQKVYPHLFPWKRTTCWRSSMQNWNLISKSSSLAISGKLLLSRNRDTVYTRSINGFSLRKSKVLSVGGSNLKWSKSMDRHSKKANEEATLAVAAVERKKREQKGATRISSGPKDKNHSSRERIFRIGSFRYKMDPSRRTLQRISDDESSFTAATHSDKDAKRSYIPKRLVIGNNEYVRIGNGNKLIRDPKKRTRLLASEKVRWSLHTARLRLARKRKYCQFFTRFGKCNKDNGRCPYIHDPSKIAVCTKFLNGLCSNANCRLTHKVIPERMPDCSYFLQGLCTNKNCPYRHVNVNPKASTCEGFLRGYCADGNECRKKHSYVCPTFEATGTCPEGTKCKLHHPKNRIQEKKRKRSREVRNARGRYFGSPDLCVSKSRKAVFEKNFAQDYNDILSDGNLTDFVAMDVSDDDLGESNDPTSEQTTFCDSDTSELQSEDLDELIKPVRLMDTSLTV